MPVIGFLSSSSPAGRTSLTTAFRQGLRDSSYIETKNVTIEYRWAEDEYDRLPALAVDLVQRQVAVIAATDSPSAIAAKAATATIPIVFMLGGDPVQLGLVASLNRPNSNATGVTFLSATVAAKLVGLLHDLLPQAARMALLADPKMPVTESFVSDALSAASAIGKQIDVFHASTGREIDQVFTRLVQKPVDALLVGRAVLFNIRRVQLATLATYHRVPAIYTQREAAEAGGLMSYGTNFAHAQHQAGIYVARVLKGEKPADLPVLQSTKFEFVINLNTAKAFGLSFPAGLLAIADEVIE